MWWIKNAQVVDPAQGINGKYDVLVNHDRVAGIAESYTDQDVIQILGLEGTADISKAVTEVQGEGKYLFPGLIDVHVHLREPGQEDKEDIRSGSRAAVRGGFTTILAMANTKPIVDQRALVEFVKLQAERAGYARVHPISAVSKGFKGEELVEMMDSKDGGAVAFSDDGKGIQNADIMRLALEYAKLTGCPIVSHCEDENLAGQGVMRRGEASARLGLRGIPASAESVMVARDVLLAAETGGKLHLAHLSTKESVDIVRQAKKLGIDVTAEVNPHHLMFSENDITLTATSLKVNPPLPSRSDQEALLQGLLDGTIDMLATDHAPHTWEEKARPFAEVPFGITALDTALPAVWQKFVATGVLSVEKLITLWSVNPARRFGLNGGTLQVGSPADMIMFDPNYIEIVSADTMESKSQNTPFLGQILTGCPVMTWVGGKLVMQDRTVIA